MPGDDEHISAKRITGTDHGPEISLVGGPVKKNDKRIVRKRYRFKAVLAHFNYSHQLRGVLFTAELFHKFRRKTVIFVCADSFYHIFCPVGQMIPVIKKRVDLPAVFDGFIKTADTFNQKFMIAVAFIAVGFQYLEFLKSTVFAEDFFLCHFCHLAVCLLVIAAKTKCHLRCRLVFCSRTLYH